MLIRTFATAAALSLAAGGVFAQQTRDKHVDMPIAAQTGTALSKVVAPPRPALAASDAAVEVSATELSIFNRPETPYIADQVSGPTAGTNVVITNNPIPDTAENRAKYRPLSNAGRRSPARGD